MKYKRESADWSFNFNPGMCALITSRSYEGQGQRFINHLKGTFGENTNKTLFFLKRMVELVQFAQHRFINKLSVLT